MIVMVMTLFIQCHYNSMYRGAARRRSDGPPRALPLSPDRSPGGTRHAELGGGWSA